MVVAEDQAKAGLLPGVIYMKGSQVARGWYVVAVIVAAMLLAALDRQALTLLAPLIQHDLRLSDTQLSVLNGLAFVGLHALCTLAVGWAADRYNRRGLIALGLLIWSVMTGLCGLAGSFLTLLMARAGVGAGESVVVPAGYALATENAALEQRGRVMGVLIAANTVGGGLAMILSGGLLGLIGDAPRRLPVLGLTAAWQIVFLMLAFAGLPILALLFTINDRRRHSASRAPTQEPDAASGALEHLRRFRRVFAGMFVASTANSVAGFGIAAWAPMMLVRRFGMAPHDTGYIVGGAFVVGGAIGAVVSAWLSDRWATEPRHGRRLRGHVPILCIALCGLPVLVFGGSPLLCGLGLTGIAFSLNAITALSFASLHDFTPNRFRGRVTAWMQFGVMVLGFSVGPFAIALLTDYVFRDPMMIGWSILLASGLLFALALAGALLARRAVIAGKGEDAWILAAQ
jgi:MFS family permease